MRQLLDPKQKTSKHYAVKGTGEIKSVDVEKRTVMGIANTYFYIDQDCDMLLPGCCAKSIADRGPKSSAVAKIKHQADHSLSIEKSIGRLTELEEKTIDGKSVLYFESYIPDTKMGEMHLVNYQEKMYDNHSIGFKYMDLELAEKDSDMASYRKNWEEYYPKALNPEKADEQGYFFIVKEIKLYEISAVSFGSNMLTPFLGAKSEKENNLLKQDIVERILHLQSQYKSNGAKADRTNIDLEVKQLLQVIDELKLALPGKPSTPTSEPQAQPKEQPVSITALWK